MEFEIKFTKHRAIRIIQALNFLEESYTLSSSLAELRNELSIKITET